MTNISSFVLILICVAIGYVFEPIFFSDSRNSPIKPAPVLADEVVENDEAEGETEPIPDPVPADDGIQVDLSQITEADFPPKVTIKVDYTLKDEPSGVTMQLKGGTKVKPLRIEGNMLVFQPVGLPIEGKTEVTNTDFKMLAVPLMLNRLRNATAEKTSTEDEMEPEPIVEPVVEPIVEPVVEPEPVVVPEPVVEVEPVVEPEPTDDGGTVDNASIITLMKASVAAGKVTEFEAKQVVAWKVGEPLELDGQTYQTGLVTFKAETILGMQEHDAIALIDNAAVIKWMWAKTKLEMR